MAEMITRGWRADYDCKIILPFLLIRELLEEALGIGGVDSPSACSHDVVLVVHQSTSMPSLL